MHEPKGLEEVLSRFRDSKSQGQKSVELKRSNSEIESDKLNGMKVMQIRTSETGFNAGRVYYVQTETQQMCSSIIEELRQYAAAARQKANGSSRFKESQRVARTVYESTPFQIFAGFLIIAVRLKQPDFFHDIRAVRSHFDVHRTLLSASPMRS